MEFFRDSNFRFMRYRRFWAVASVLLALLGIFAVFVHGKLNVGIDFTGGTQIIVRFQEAPPIEDLRRTMAAAGFPEAQIQRFGQAESDEFIIRTALQEGEEEGSAPRVLEALDAAYDEDAGDRSDLNQRGTVAIAAALLAADPLELAAADEAMARTEYEAIAEEILQARRDLGIFSSWEEVAAVDAVTPEVLEALRSESRLGNFALLGQEGVSPAIGAELRQRGIWAVVLSILGMMGYIWVRFELRFGVGAVLATVHDVLVVLGLFALLNYEFNLSTIAAFLTLVGYSVNDSVVVFDRVRENLRRSRRKSFEETIDESLNQTLSRTVLTSGTTMLAVGSLYFLGGEVLRGFSFVLLVGIVVGTYSSVFVASSFALMWENLTERRGGGRTSRTAAKKGGGDRKMAVGE